MKVKLTKTEKIGIPFLALIVLFAIWQGYSKEKFKSNFETCSKKVTSCFISEAKYHKLKTSGLIINYSYSLDGLDFDGYYNLGNSWMDEAEIDLIGRIVPCVFCEFKPEISIPLISEDQFKELGLNYPDSLAWLKDYKIKNRPE